MQLSVIIPTWNEEASIERAVAAALRLDPAEVIVVDGGSRDATRQIAAGLDCRLLESPPGRAAQQNAGAAAATGDVLLFLHADCWLEPAGRRQLEKALHDRAVESGAFRQQIDAQGLGYRLLEWGNARRVLWGGPAYGDQGLFFRREVFEALGRFPQVRLMEDLLIMRAARRRSPPALLPGPLHVSPRRWQQRGVVRQTLRNWALLTAHRLGAHPDRLAAYYPRHE